MLLGGSPLRLFRLSRPGPRRSWRAGGPGAPVGPSAAATARWRGAWCQPARSCPGRGDHVRPRRRHGRGARCATGPRNSTGCSASLEGLACIVVDDASADAGADRGGRRAPRRSVRRVGRPTSGPRAPATPGWTRVHTSLVAFVDSDCVPSDGVARTAAGPLRRSRWSPPSRRGSYRAAARGQRARSPATRRCGRRSTGARARGPCGRGGRSPSCRARRSSSGPTWSTGPALFDPSLRGGEDVDLVWRLVEAGWDVRYVPASTVAHDGPATLRSFAGAPRLLRDDGRTPGPAPPGRARTRARLGVVAGGVDAAAGPPAPARAGDARGVHRHPGRAAHGPRAGSRLGGDPHRRRRHGARRRCRRSRAWPEPGHRRCCSGWPSAAPARRRPAPSLLPALGGLGSQPRRRSTRSASPPSTWPTTLAYGAGVWAGCARERIVTPLRPRISSHARAWTSRTLREGLER